ncbi:MAG TPA: alpha/beta hydrolase [Rudaea sp.]|nr:alpha/beta hydrolase [Rudaea sp.]
MRCPAFALILCALCGFAHADPPKLEEGDAEVNGVRLHYAAAGSGPLILFLHGYPEFWYQWKPQLLEFGKDFRAVAPDMRGYDLSSKPTDVAQYRVKVLVEDVRQLAEKLGGGKKFVLVGQDWGGAIAWAFALYHPERLDKLVVINAPHPALFDRELKENPAQQWASRYMLTVRAPGAAQHYGDDGYAALVHVVLGEHPDDAERAAYIAAWSQPGALESALNYYRAAALGPPDPKTHAPADGNYTPDLASTRVNVPTLVVWGLKDPYLLAGNLSGIGRYVEHLTVRVLPDASHWANRERPDEVNAYIRQFLAGEEPTTTGR